MLFSTTLVLASLSLICAAPAPAVRRDVFCALCPSLDLADEPIVASSGGTQGVPRFCGFQAKSTSSDVTVSPTTICFYSNDGTLFYSSTELCPQTTELYSPCPFVP